MSVAGLLPTTGRGSRAFGPPEPSVPSIPSMHSDDDIVAPSPVIHGTLLVLRRKATPCFPIAKFVRSSLTEYEIQFHFGKKTIEYANLKSWKMGSGLKKKATNSTAKQQQQKNGSASQAPQKNWLSSKVQDFSRQILYQRGLFHFSQVLSIRNMEKSEVDSLISLENFVTDKERQMVRKMYLLEIIFLRHKDHALPDNFEFSRGGSPGKASSFDNVMNLDSTGSRYTAPPDWKITKSDSKIFSTFFAEKSEKKKRLSQREAIANGEKLLKKLDNEGNNGFNASRRSKSSSVGSNTNQQTKCLILLTTSASQRESWMARFELALESIDCCTKLSPKLAVNNRYLDDLRAFSKGNQLRIKQINDQLGASQALASNPAGQLTTDGQTTIHALLNGQQTLNGTTLKGPFTIALGDSLKKSDCVNMSSFLQDLSVLDTEAQEGGQNSLQDSKGPGRTSVTMRESPMDSHPGLEPHPVWDVQGKASQHGGVGSQYSGASPSEDVEIELEMCDPSFSSQDNSYDDKRGGLTTPEREFYALYGTSPREIERNLALQEKYGRVLDLSIEEGGGNTTRTGDAQHQERPSSSSSSSNNCTNDFRAFEQKSFEQRKQADLSLHGELFANLLDENSSANITPMNTGSVARFGSKNGNAGRKNRCNQTMDDVIGNDDFGISSIVRSAEKRFKSWSEQKDGPDGRALGDSPERSIGEARRSLKKSFKTEGVMLDMMSDTVKTDGDNLESLADTIKFDMQKQSRRSSPLNQSGALDESRKMSTVGKSVDLSETVEKTVDAAAFSKTHDGPLHQTVDSPWKTVECGKQESGQVELFGKSLEILRSSMANDKNQDKNQNPDRWPSSWPDDADCATLDAGGWPAVSPAPNECVNEDQSGETHTFDETSKSEEEKRDVDRSNKCGEDKKPAQLASFIQPNMILRTRTNSRGTRTQVPMFPSAPDCCKASASNSTPASRSVPSNPPNLGAPPAEDAAAYDNLSPLKPIGGERYLATDGNGWPVGNSPGENEDDSFPVTNSELTRLESGFGSLTLSPTKATNIGASMKNKRGTAEFGKATATFGKETAKFGDSGWVDFHGSVDSSSIASDPYGKTGKIRGSGKLLTATGLRDTGEFGKPGWQTFSGGANGGDLGAVPKQETDDVAPLPTNGDEAEDFAAATQSDDLAARRYMIQTQNDLAFHQRETQDDLSFPNMHETDSFRQTFADTIDNSTMGNMKDSAFNMNQSSFLTHSFDKSDEVSEIQQSKDFNRSTNNSLSQSKDLGRSKNDLERSTNGITNNSNGPFNASQSGAFNESNSNDFNRTQFQGTQIPNPGLQQTMFYQTDLGVAGVETSLMENSWDEDSELDPIPVNGSPFSPAKTDLWKR